METLKNLREYIDNTPIDELQKEWDSLTSHKYDEKISEGTELDNWIGWIQIRIPELKKQHNAFWLRQAMQGYAEEFKNLNLGGVSGTPFLYDELNKREVKVYYKDEAGYYIDCDPHGLSMSGKRTIIPADRKRYTVHYR